MTIKAATLVAIATLAGIGCGTGSVSDEQGVVSQSLPLGYDGPNWADEAGASARPLEMTLPPSEVCHRWAAYNGTGTSCTAYEPCSLSTCMSQLGATHQVCCLQTPPAGQSYVVTSTLRPAASGSASRPLVLRKAPAAPSPASKPGTNSPCTLNSGRVTVTLNANTSLLSFEGSGGSARNWWAVEGIDFNLNGKAGGSAIVHPHQSTGLLLRDLVVRDGAFKNALLLNGDDAQVLDNCIYNHFRADAGDAHAMTVSGSYGLGVAQRVQVANNWIYDAGGDGLQCNDGSDVDYGSCTPSPTCTLNPAGAPADVWVQDNRIFTTVGKQALTENAIDIKSCSKVTIGGTVSPRKSPAVGEVAQNKFSGFRGKSTAPGGVAVVLHMNAKQVLIENTRIWDCGGGIAMGRGEAPWSWYVTGEIVIRSNLIFNLCSGTGCSGHGIRLNKSRRVDIFDNTLDSIPATAFRIGIDNQTSEPSEDIDLWNNVVRSSGARWVETSRGKLLGFESGYNLFWAPDATATTVKFRADGCMGSTGGLTWWKGCADGTALKVTDNVGSAPYASSVADPLFDSSYYTAPSSPARDSAKTGVGYTYTDWSGAGPDKGFRETY